MRYVTLRITSPDESVHTIPRSVVPSSVGRGPIHRIELLDDGSVVELRSVSGDLDAYRAVLAEHDDVYAYSITGTDDGCAFLHYEPTGVTRSLLHWRRRFPVVVEPPIEFDGDDPVVTLVGEVAEFSEATASLPDAVTYEVSETGEFSPQLSVPFRGLTARQREILVTAIEAGYYENPREATQADLAETLSLSPGTVGDHLRTIEAHVFSQHSGLLGRSVVDR